MKSKICINNNFDIHKVIKAANTKPLVLLLLPGPVKSHCIPIDPFLLAGLVKVTQNQV